MKIQKFILFFENLRGVGLFSFVALISLCAIAAGAIVVGYQEPVYDARAYAHDGHTFVLIPEQRETIRHDSVVIAPLYPAALAFLAMLDARLDKALECFAAAPSRGGSGCDVDGLALIYWVQIVLSALSAVALFYTAENITSNRLISLATLIFIIIFGKFSIYSIGLITESFYFLFFFCFVYFSSCFLFSAPNKRFMFFAGLFLSLAALVRPSYIYLYYALFIFLPAYLIFLRNVSPRKTAAVSLTFLVPFCSLVLPWMLRNLEYYGVFDVSVGYGSSVLIERVAFNMMTWREFLVSWIYWLPDFGDNLAAFLFAPEYWRRLDFFHPEGFYLVGNSEFKNTINSLASTGPERLRILIGEYILAEPFKHVIVTLALAWRGMLVGKYFSLFGVAALFPALRLLKKRHEIDKLLAFAFPFFFMLGFNAFVSVNPARYNVPLVFIYSLAISVVLMSLVSFLQQKITGGRNSQTGYG